MAEFTQDNRLIQVITPLGKDELLLRSFSGQEAVSKPFHFDLQTVANLPAERIAEHDQLHQRENHGHHHQRR